MPEDRHRALQGFRPPSSDPLRGPYDRFRANAQAMKYDPKDPELYTVVWAWSTRRYPGGSISFEIMHAEYEGDTGKTICGKDMTKSMWEGNGDTIVTNGHSVSCKRCTKGLRTLGFDQYLEPDPSR